MELDIFSEGKEYISAAKAAQNCGYASDYIGQLCRTGKIPGKLIGRTWYVDYSALVEYKKKHKAGRRTSAQQENPIALPTSGGLRHDSDFPAAPSSSDTKKISSLASASIRGSRKIKLLPLSPVLGAPLLPPLSKRSRHTAAANISRYLKNSMALALVAAIVLSSGLATLRYVEPELSSDMQRSMLDALGAVPLKSGILALAADLVASFHGIIESIIYENSL